MSTGIPPMREVDFMILKEDWSRYLLHDGTELRVRTVVRKIVEQGQPNPMGYPNFGLESINAVSAIVPERLKRKPSTEILDVSKEKGQELKFTPRDELWQEYQTTTGFKVLVKPILTKVFVYEKYNGFGEPIYNAIVQPLINVEKMSES